MKKISKGLILALVIQIALILPLGTIFLLPKTAKADNSLPNLLTEHIGMVFTSEAQNSILVRYHRTYSPSRSPFEDFTFSKVGQITNNGVSTVTQLRGLFGGTEWDSINNLGISQNFIKYKLSTDDAVYLIIAQKSAPDTLFYNLGVFRNRAIDNKFVFHELRTSLGENAGGLVNVSETSGGYFGHKIETRATIAQRCQQMNNQWVSFIGHMEDLLGKNPSENGDYWIDGEPAGTIGRVLKAFQWAQIAASIPTGTTLFIGAAQSMFNDWVGWNGQVKLNAQGAEKAEIIRNLSLELNQIAHDLKGNDGAWPIITGSTCKPGKINVTDNGDGTYAYTTSTSEFYDNAGTFIDDVNKLTELFNQAISERTDGSSGDKECPSLMSADAMRYGIFNVLFCILAEDIFHGLAKNIMEYAQNWLTDAIGLEVNTVTTPGTAPTNAGQVDQTDQGTERNGVDIPITDYSQEESVDLDMLEDMAEQ